MSFIRWFKISRALADGGNSVDIAVARLPAPARRKAYGEGGRLRFVPIKKVRWRDYDIVKTLFHEGFETLERFGGDRHPFIVSKLGSVVDRRDRDGIFFFGRQRERLFATQERIHERSRFVALLSRPAVRLWTDLFGSRRNVLLVPGAASRRLPPDGRDPYPDAALERCLYAGNIYTRDTQAEANRILVDKLNRLGKELTSRGVRLYFLGLGDSRRLDPRFVTDLGCVDYERAWSFIRYADVGTALVPGRFLHNNESTKIYHYLRAGLPTVTEAGFPNDAVVRATSLGAVSRNNDMRDLAAKIRKKIDARVDGQIGVRYILKNHTWDARAAIYQRVFDREFS